MDRTTLVLDNTLKRRLKDKARKMNISMAELIRMAISRFIDSKGDDSGYERDSLFADQAVFTGESPEDLSFNHDKYLYDE
jgi:predicted transcriptional regulator